MKVRIYTEKGEWTVFGAETFPFRDGQVFDLNGNLLREPA